MTLADTVHAPGERFHVAQHLLQANAQRPAKTACIDGRGRLSYGEPADPVRRVAGALRALGLRREQERAKPQA
jgi:benzoate-CoA ligase